MTGAPTCGTPSSVDPATGYVIPAVVVPNCTPIDIFNTDLPATIGALKQMSTDYKTDNTFVTKSATFNLNGKVVAMPAGDLQAAVGVEYRKLSTIFEADHLVIAQPPLFIKCIISQEACTGPSTGRYDDKEVYAEFFVPLLKDMPGAKALNLDIGVRYSSYSLFGNTTKAQFKVEYRPISDLLLRGTYSQVFRVPTLGDLFAAPAISNPTFNDPCYGLTAAQAAANPNLAAACVGVLGNGKPDGSYAFNGTSQITAVLLSNPNLKPETGNVVTYGFVLQVPGVQNLSISVDMWRGEWQSGLLQPEHPLYLWGEPGRGEGLPAADHQPGRIEGRRYRLRREVPAEEYACRQLQFLAGRHLHQQLSEHAFPRGGFAGDRGNV